MPDIPTVLSPENPATGAPASRPDELLRLVENLPNPRILLIGDWMLDEYIYGHADRLSPEAPVPVVNEKHRTRAAGGAGNVAVFLARLGAVVNAVGIRGADASGAVLAELLESAGVNTAGLITHPGRPTSTKTRLVGLAQHRHPQQMLRLDYEDASPIGPPGAAALLDFVRQQVAQCDLVCLEDYNKGVLTTEICQEIIAIARHAGREVLVDPALIADYQKYRGAAAITPNRTEAELATGLKLADSWQAAPQLATALMDRLDLQACILTLDRHGMYLLKRDQPGAMHSTRPRTVYDVTGAGDMVLAVLAMARAGGATWEQAVDLGNIGGGLEVEKFGCVPLSREEIMQDLLEHQSRRMGKQRTGRELALELARRRQRGEKIVFTNGVFDILHAGHVQYLAFARNLGDLLVVGVNADDSVRRLKGPARPVNSLADRMAVLEALAAVDYIVRFDDDTPEELVRTLTPDILVKGQDYAGQAVAGGALVEARGGKVIFAPLLEGRSTTGVIARSRRDA